MDKIAFTGSSATARKVMAACAQNLTPMIAECGGKDALLVGTDAKLAALVAQLMPANYWRWITLGMKR